MHVISIDIETFSDIDLGKCGVYRYAESPSFDILLFSYSIDDGQIKLIDLAGGEKLPEEIIKALMDASIIKTAFNANFERVCLMKYLCRILGKEVYLDPSSWRCSEVQAAMLGLPLHLEGVAQVLQLEEQKMSEGKALIRYFCMPCKPTVANGGRTRNLPSDAPEKWEQFKAYNIRDVGVELAIRKKLEKYPIPEAEHDLYVLDQKINDRGFQADMNFVMQAITCDRQFSVAATPCILGSFLIMVKIFVGVSFTEPFLFSSKVNCQVRSSSSTSSFKSPSSSNFSNSSLKSSSRSLASCFFTSLSSVQNSSIAL
jgi:DNA polymerase